MNGQKSQTPRLSCGTQETDGNNEQNAQTVSFDDAKFIQRSHSDPEYFVLFAHTKSELISTVRNFFSFFFLLSSQSLSNSLCFAHHLYLQPKMDGEM